MCTFLTPSNLWMLLINASLACSFVWYVTWLRGPTSQLHISTGIDHCSIQYISSRYFSSIPSFSKHYNILYIGIIHPSNHFHCTSFLNLCFLLHYHITLWSIPCIPITLVFFQFTFSFAVAQQFCTLYIIVQGRKTMHECIPYAYCALTMQ